MKYANSGLGAFLDISVYFDTADLLSSSNQSKVFLKHSFHECAWSWIADGA